MKWTREIKNLTVGLEREEKDPDKGKVKVTYEEKNLFKPTIRKLDCR